MVAPPSVSAPSSTWSTRPPAHPLATELRAHWRSPRPRPQLRQLVARCFDPQQGQAHNRLLVNLLDMSTEWKVADGGRSELFEGVDRKSGQKKWTDSLRFVFGHQAELRSYAEVYAQADNADKFSKDFVAAWNKVMNLDRFDVKKSTLPCQVLSSLSSSVSYLCSFSWNVYSFRIDL